MSSVHFRETGAGPGVVCLHSNASTSNQWRSLMETLAPRYHVLAADSYGAGKSPSWPTGRFVGLGDEVALVKPVFERAGDDFALVGHSYGAAVALIAALRQPHRCRALIVYEPTMFALIDAGSPQPNDADGIREVVADAILCLDADDPHGAAKRFIDYWMGAGAWSRMPDRTKAAIAISILNVGHWKDALFTEGTPLESFSELNMPVLLMLGGHSPASSRSVAMVLAEVLPCAQVVEFGDLGHMGPITHPAIVNSAVLAFLEQHHSGAICNRC